MIINLVGQPGVGKTTLAKILVQRLNGINIDGDELREMFQNKDYSEAGRRNNIQNAYNIAIFLEQKGFVPIISLVSPFSDIRENLKTRTNVLEIYLKTSEIRGRENFHVKNFEEPKDNCVIIDTGTNSIEESINIILQKL